MNKDAHGFMGIAIIGAGLYVNNFSFTDDKKLIAGGLFAIGVLVGSFLPDIDAEYSYAKSKFPILPEFYGELQSMAKKTKAEKFFKHRGILMHSIWTIIFMMIVNFLISLMFNNLKSNKPLLAQINIEFLLNGLVLGVLGHHILDMLTRNGLKYFYPWNYSITKYTFKKPFKFLIKYIKSIKKKRRKKSDKKINM